MADLKSLLKEARKLIDEKNYKEAQECCKNILRKDKQNYFALVLLGKSLEESDQAPLAYQKAIACKADHPLAWFGLASYYERKDDLSNKEKLIPIYGEILMLQIEEDKALETVAKLFQTGKVTKSTQVIKIFLSFIQRCEKGSKVREETEAQIIELLKCGTSCEDTDVCAIIDIVSKTNAKNQSEPLELVWAKLILQKDDLASALKEIINLNFFSKNKPLRQWLCSYIFKKYVEKDSLLGFDLESNIKLITDSIEKYKWAELLKCIACYENALFLDAYKQCLPLIDFHQPEKEEAIFAIQCTLKLKKWSMTEKLAKSFLMKFNEPNFTSDLKKFLFYALANQNKWKEAVTAVQGIPKELLTLKEQAVLVECFLELNETCTPHLDALQDTIYYLPLKALQLLKQENYFEAVALIEGSKVQDSLTLFYLGKAYWELKEYEKCQINLLKAAKLNSEHADTFLYLGHFYCKFSQDLIKARKCYEKAYNLNSFDNEIVKNLSDIYSKLELKDEDFELLKVVVKQIQKDECWVYFRLGLHYLNRREWENAIIHFRSVIKKNHNDTTAFECLADAYFSRGSYTSALRAYNKVMALDSNKIVHCTTRIGYIYSLLTQYQEAISTFEKVLTISPDSILALKGIAETWMRIAKKKVEAKMYGSARDCAQQAINYISKALKRYTQYICIWKMFGDILMFVTKLPNKYVYIFIKPFEESDEVLVEKDKLGIFPQAIACYSHIAKQKQQVASYDLATTYFAFYQASKNNVNCQIAFNLAINCIRIKPSAWRNWNLLGKICFDIKKYNLAQHCFIKALQVTRKWSVAKIWCNLGALYLKLKLYKKSNYCFWRGQSTLPSYPQSWIGQGLIAEAIREDEAMDLFRHASRLGYHRESSLGYADWVCRTLKTNYNTEDLDSKYVIEDLHAIPYAVDLVEWFSCFEPNDACACTILGILQERCGLIHAAFKSYENALRLADETKRNITLLNMGRILVRMKNYDEAIKVYKAITEASLDSTCGLAIALLKKGLYEECYSVYDTAFQWLSNEDIEKADLLVAMAGILYLFKGPDDAKTLLFHSIQVAQKKPTAYSLFAICSLGLLHSDQSLSKLALSELQRYEKDYNFSFDIGFLKSYAHVCEENLDQAIKILSEQLHDHPNNALLWFCLAQYCLMLSSVKARVASSCAQRALCSGRNNNTQIEQSMMLATASIAENIAGNKIKSLSLAKQGLHLYPQKTEIWAALLFSLLSDKEDTERRTWLIAAAGYMRRHLEISRPLSRWTGLVEKKLSAYS